MNKKKKFTFIDLFAEIGGMRLAFQRAGGQCVFSSEIDKYAKKTYPIPIVKINPAIPGSVRVAFIPANTATTIIILSRSAMFAKIPDPL